MSGRNTLASILLVATASAAPSYGNECNVVPAGSPRATAVQVAGKNLRLERLEGAIKCQNVRVVPLGGDVYLMYRKFDETAAKVHCKSETPCPPVESAGAIFQEMSVSGGKQAGESGHAPKHVPYGVISSPARVSSDGDFVIQGGPLQPGKSYKVSAGNYSGSFTILGEGKASKLQADLEQLKSRTDLDERAKVIEELLILSTRGLQFEAEALFDQLQR